MSGSSRLDGWMNVHMYLYVCIFAKMDRMPMRRRMHEAVFTFNPLKAKAKAYTHPILCIIIGKRTIPT